MKKILTNILLYSIIFLISCNNNLKQVEIKNLKIEKYLDSLQKKYKGFEKNSAIKDELNSNIFKNIKTEINQGILNDLPLQLKGIKKCHKSYILELEFTKLNNYYKDAELNYKRILNKIEIIVFAETNEKTAKSLIEGEFYITEIEFKDCLNIENKNKYCIDLLWSPFMGYWDDELQFGAISAKLKKIEKINKLK